MEEVREEGRMCNFFWFLLITRVNADYFGTLFVVFFAWVVILNDVMYCAMPLWLGWFSYSGRPN